MDFKGKTVIVTGAAGGIGSAITEYFIGHGANLALVDVNKSALQKAAKESIIYKHADECLATEHTIMIPADLKQEEGVRKVIEKTVKMFGRIDVLINNAAISSKQSILQENFMEKYGDTFDINLKAPMMLTNLAVPYLLKTKGNVVNITSVGGIHPLPELSIYNASKAALRHFTKCVALELAPKGVRVNSIAPAGVKTGMVKLLGVEDVEEFERKRATQLPLRKMVNSSEVADLVGFLASDQASSITGAEFVIDAGHLLGGGTPDYNSKN
ncbi:enoyl-(Acyl carrier protein) reductase domain-containing protein [Phthorimaea operculella]|nr:enoyl-(Acyl carrier protein) reductase domain-containing protein [Phthorimaea operculella]KAI5631576.1 enoyl-(Acyl carrier protein) reductase domain-containing protein [Phthorimaea operculella]